MAALAGLLCFVACKNNDDDGDKNTSTIYEAKGVDFGDANGDLTLEMKKDGNWVASVKIPNYHTGDYYKGSWKGDLTKDGEITIKLEWEYDPEGKKWEPVESADGKTKSTISENGKKLTITIEAYEMTCNLIKK